MRKKQMSKIGKPSDQSPKAELAPQPMNHEDFGAWAGGGYEDGLAYQERMRKEWGDPDRCRKSVEDSDALD